RSKFESSCVVCLFFFSSRRRHTRSYGDWSSDVCSSDLPWRPISEPRSVSVSRIACAARPSGRYVRSPARMVANDGVPQRTNQVEIGRDTSELQSPYDLVCRLLLEKKKKRQCKET